jgi:hypothetical protein
MGIRAEPVATTAARRGGWRRGGPAGVLGRVRRRGRVPAASGQVLDPLVVIVAVPATLVPAVPLTAPVPAAGLASGPATRRPAARVLLVGGHLGIVVFATRPRNLMLRPSGAHDVSRS